MLRIFLTARQNFRWVVILSIRFPLIGWLCLPSICSSTYSLKATISHLFVGSILMDIISHDIMIYWLLFICISTYTRLISLTKSLIYSLWWCIPLLLIGNYNFWAWSSQALQLPKPVSGSLFWLLHWFTSYLFVLLSALIEIFWIFSKSFMQKQIASDDTLDTSTSCCFAINSPFKFFCWKSVNYCAWTFPCFWMHTSGPSGHINFVCTNWWLWTCQVQNAQIWVKNDKTLTSNNSSEMDTKLFDHILWSA